MLFFFFALFLVSFVKSDECKGVMDIVFLLDRSGSVSNNWSDEKDFTEDVVSVLSIADDKTKVCVADYTTEGSSVDTCPGSDWAGRTFKYRYGHKFSDTQTTDAVLNSIQNNMDKGTMSYTPTGMALKTTLQEAIGSHRSDVMKVVVLITDGTPTCDNDYGTYGNEPDMANVWAEKVKDAGYLLVVVGVGSEKQVMRDWSSTNAQTGEDYYYSVSSFEELNEFVGVIRNLTCVDIFVFDPPSACRGEEEVIVNAWGFGFRDDGNPMCKFYDEEQGTLGYVDGEVISPEHFICVLDDDSILKKKGKYYVDVSFNGVHYTNAKKIFEIKNCDSYSEGMWALPLTVSTIGFIALLITTLVLIGLMLLLALSTTAVATKVAVKAPIIEEMEMPDQEPLPEPEPEPEPEMEPYIPPPKIKRSMYYVGGKAVGVDWGKEGMAWDSPFRGADMGMGQKYAGGLEKKNKLYDDIQKRKLERMKQQRLEEMKNQND